MLKNIRVSICFFILGFHNGGVEKVLYSYLSHMNCDDFDLHIVTHMDPDPLRQKMFTDMGCQIHQLSRVHGHKINKRNIREYNELFQTYRFDIVHNNFPENLLPLLMAKKYKVPVRILHSHNDYEACFFNKSEVVKKIYKLALKVNVSMATHYLACGKKAGESVYGKKMVDRGAVKVLNNAIVPEKFLFDEACRKEMRENLGLGDAFTVGHVGRYENQQKNQEFVVDVFNELLKIEPNAKLLMLGEGKNRNSIMERTEKLGIADRVIFTGAVNNVSDYLQAMDVFLFPSRFEGFSVATIEVQCTGLPGVMSDTISSEMNILGLFDVLSLSESPKVWAQHVLDKKQMIRKDQTKEISAAGYNIEIEAKLLENMYRDAIV